MEYEIKPAGKFSVNANEVWAYKELFYFFAWRDIKVKYKQTALGFVWAILQPTLMMLVFTFLFGKAIGADTNGTLPYPVFVYSGLMLWGIFAGGIQSAGNSMVANANIIKKIYFPRLIIPMSAVLISIFDFFMTLIPFIFLLFFFHISIDWFRLLVFFPSAIVLMLVTTFGLGCFLAALNVKYRDVRYIIPFMIQFLLFASPIIYQANIVTNEYVRFMLMINPVSVAIDLYRAAFDQASVLNYQIVSIGVCISVCFLFIGIYYFRKTESYFADLA